MVANDRAPSAPFADKRLRPNTLAGAPTFFLPHQWSTRKKVDAKKGRLIAITPWVILVKGRLIAITPWVIPVKSRLIATTQWLILVKGRLIGKFSREFHKKVPIYYCQKPTGCAQVHHQVLVGAPTRAVGAPANNLQDSRLRPKGALSAHFFARATTTVW